MIWFNKWADQLDGVLAANNINLLREDNMDIEVFDSMDAPSSNGTSLKGYVIAAYQDLLNVLGEPTFDEPSADSKTWQEWIVGYDQEIYTIYSWKQPENPADNPLETIRWHVGGYSSAFDFIDALEKELGK
jgi:hypothetical protein